MFAAITDIVVFSLPFYWLVSKKLFQAKLTRTPTAHFVQLNEIFRKPQNFGPISCDGFFPFLFSIQWLLLLMVVFCFCPRDLVRSKSEQTNALVWTLDSSVSYFAVLYPARTYYEIYCDIVSISSFALALAVCIIIINWIFAHSQPPFSSPLTDCR